MNFFIDTHTHTLASGHAYNTIEEMAEQAVQNGLKILGITEHGPAMPGSCHQFYFHNLHAIDRDYLQEKYGIEVLIGAELNIMNAEGKIDVDRKGMEELDVSVASLHLPCIPSASMEKNTEALIAAIRNPEVDIIGHPDDARFPLDYEPIVKAAKQYGKLLEVNNSSLKPHSYRVGARENYITMLKYCMEYKQPIIVNSDAHYRSAVGAHLHAEAVLKEVNFPEELVINGYLEKFKTYIRKYRK